MVKQMESHANQVNLFFKAKEVRQMKEQHQRRVKKMKPKKKQVKHHDDDDVYLDQMVALNQVEIKKYTQEMLKKD